MGNIGSWLVASQVHPSRTVSSCQSSIQTDLNKTLDSHVIATKHKNTNMQKTKLICRQTSFIV
jgi:hypothetical protein